jgi:hypothetical protein
MASALRTHPRIARSDERQNRLMPVAWMMARNGDRPALVWTAPPRGIGP